MTCAQLHPSPFPRASSALVRPRASSDQVRPKAFCSFLETAGIKAPFGAKLRIRGVWATRRMGTLLEQSLIRSRNSPRFSAHCARAREAYVVFLPLTVCVCVRHRRPLPSTRRLNPE